MLRSPSQTLLCLAVCFGFFCGPKAEMSADQPVRTTIDQTEPKVSSEPRTANSVNAVIGKWHEPIQFCYRKTVRRNPTVQGKVVVRFTIAPCGEVEDVTVVSSTVSDQGLVECVSRNVSRLQFPPVHESLGSLTVTYPFIFGES